MRKYLLAPLLGAALIAGCGSDTTTTVVQTSEDGGPATTTTQEEGGPLVLGQVAELDSTSTSLRVTAEKSYPIEVGSIDRQVGVSDDALGVDLRIENTGDSPYQDSPSNGATLITKDDKQIPAAFLTEGSCSANGFASNLNLSPGDERVGCIAFDLAGAKPDTFQWSPDSGFGEAAEWKLGD